MKLGILGYGSIISHPGWEIEQASSTRLDARTPFPVEYARSSSGRAGAPTVVQVPEGRGCPVKARVFVLKEGVSEQQALDMLYRRERDKVGVIPVQEGIVSEDSR